MVKNKLPRRFRRLASFFEQDTSGAVSVEFVLWVPVFILILLLIADSSMLLLEQTRMWQIANNTSRSVAVGRITPDSAPDFAKSQSRFGANYTVIVTTNGGVVVTQIAVPIRIVSFTRVFAFAGDSIMSVKVIQRIEPTTSS